ARARVAAGEPELPPMPTAAEIASADPVTTVRMQRDRILRALADDIAANATSTAAGAAAAAPGERPSTQPGQPAQAAVRAEISRILRHRGRAATQPGRAASQPPTGELADEVFDDDFDPVAIASAAIARLRERARTDLAGLRVQYHRHDIVVLVIAFVIIVVAGRVHEGLVIPPPVPFEPGADHGLSFDPPRACRLPAGGPPPAPRIAHDIAPPPARPVGGPYRVELTSTAAPAARIEVLIDKKPAWSNIVTGLDLDRRTRWG